MSDVTEKKRPTAIYVKRNSPPFYSGYVYKKHEADSIFEDLESDNQRLRKLLTEVEGVAPEKWTALESERDALKARVEELEKRLKYATFFFDSPASFSHEEFRGIADKVHGGDRYTGKVPHLDEREQAESDLAREKERSARLRELLVEARVFVSMKRFPELSHRIQVELGETR